MLRTACTPTCTPTCIPTCTATCRLLPARCVALAYAVLLASAFNYFAFAWAARRSSASHVTAFFPLQVVAAAALQVRACRLVRTTHRTMHRTTRRTTHSRSLATFSGHSNEV